jgi:hypothetical protein
VSDTESSCRTGAFDPSPVHFTLSPRHLQFRERSPGDELTTCKCHFPHSRLPARWVTARLIKFLLFTQKHYGHIHCVSSQMTVNELPYLPDVKSHRKKQHNIKTDFMFTLTYLLAVIMVMSPTKRSLRVGSSYIHASLQKHV